MVVHGCDRVQSPNNWVMFEQEHQQWSQMQLVEDWLFHRDLLARELRKQREMFKIMYFLLYVYTVYSNALNIVIGKCTF